MTDSPAPPVLRMEVKKQLRDYELSLAISTTARRVVLFGPSGSGKSVTLRLIAGGLQPDSGFIEVDGRMLVERPDGVRLPMRLRRVGYVPQGYALFPHLSVEQNVAFGLKELAPAEREERVREALQRVSLEDVRRESVRRLSGGQQQRVAIARAIAPRPALMLLDEPFSALDTVLRPQLRDELVALQEEAQIPMVLVTHDLADAFRVAQWLVVIDRGTVLQQGPPALVFARPATAQVARLLGVRNVLPARVVEVREGQTDVEWMGRILTAEHGELEGTRTAVGDDVLACIRPTHIMIRLPSRSYEGRFNTFIGTIVEEAPGSETHRLFVQLNGSSGRYDIEIELPGYAYHRLELDRRKEIEMSVRPSLVHLVRE